MRGLLAAILAFGTCCPLLCGCNATGSEQGGQPLAPDPCASPQLGHTWTELYACYFGPSGKASCSSQSQCHGTLSGTGAAISSFVCGTDKDACWFSMTHPLYVLQGTLTPCDAGAAEADGSCPMPPEATADASADAASVVDAAPICTCNPSPYSPLVPTGGTAEAPGTHLWSTLYGASTGCSGALCNNMPCANLGQNCPNGTAAYTFTADDLARISAWIKEGAQDN